MGQARSRADLNLKTFGDFHSNTSANQLTLHWPQRDVLNRANVHARASNSLIFGKNRSRFQGNSNLDCHRKGCYRRILPAMQVHRISDTFTLLTEVPGRPWQLADSIQHRFRRKGVREVVASYHSIGVYTDPGVEIDYSAVEAADLPLNEQVTVHRIPICYELGPDLDEVCRLCNLRREAFISAHSSVTYRCYAVGFQPGFPYLGYVPPEITAIDRLDRPRDRVPAGAVGITLGQCGIYPNEMPGGWRLIGLTPLKIVDVEAKWFPISAGNQVIFERISELSYRDRLGERLGDA